MTPLKTQLRDLSSRFALPTPPPDLAAKEAAYLLGCGSLSGRIRELAEKRASEMVKEERLVRVDRLREWRAVAAKRYKEVAASGVFS